VNDVITTELGADALRLQVVSLPFQQRPSENVAAGADPGSEDAGSRANGAARGDGGTNADDPSSGGGTENRTACGDGGTSTDDPSSGKGTENRTARGDGGTDAVETVELTISGREIAFVLIRGAAEIALPDGDVVHLGPRPDPFTVLPTAVLVSDSGSYRFRGAPSAVVAVASSPTRKRYPTRIIRPEDVRERARGRDNWSRTVRFVCWSDNTEGEQLLIGETVTPSGNWSTIPPHRHARFVDSSTGAVEVPYQEIYFYQFSHPAGFGLSRQFDDDGSDQSCTMVENDAIYIDGGYHPVVCAPGTTMYQLTVMAGPFRVSTASIHPEFRHLLAGTEENPFRNQERR
jgi:5-deoxy-glucuronate isomerase